MKKFVLITAIATLLASTAGCRCFEGLRRGAVLPAGAQTVICDPCPPCAPVAPCDPCAAPPAAVVPGPTTTYVPGPVN